MVRTDDNFWLFYSSTDKGRVTEIGQQSGILKGIINVGTCDGDTMRLQ